MNNGDWEEEDDDEHSQLLADAVKEYLSSTKT